MKNINAIGNSLKKPFKEVFFIRYKGQSIEEALIRETEDFIENSKNLYNAIEGRFENHKTNHFERKNKAMPSILQEFDKNVYIPINELSSDWNQLYQNLVTYDYVIKYFENEEVDYTKEYLGTSIEQTKEVYYEHYNLFKNIYTLLHDIQLTFGDYIITQELDEEEFGLFLQSCSSCDVGETNNNNRRNNVESFSQGIVDKKTNSIDVKQIGLEVEFLRDIATDVIFSIRNFYSIITAKKTGVRNSISNFIEMSGVWSKGYHSLIRYNHLLNYAYKEKYRGAFDEIAVSFNAFKVLHDDLVKVRTDFPNEVITDANIEVGFDSFIVKKKAS